MTATNRFLELVDKLPESTDAWSCRWFQAIVVTAFFVIVFALRDMNGVEQNIALITSSVIGGYVFGMRRTNEGVPACRV